MVAANHSVRLANSDPESHRARAEVFHHFGQTVEAVRELEIATSLRPGDHHLWLSLGMVREQIEDLSGALIAFNEAVRLAPFYARPRWQRGNFLLRMGRSEEALADLRMAAESDPELSANVIDLVWVLSKGDVQETKRIAGVSGPRLHLVFAQFLARQGRIADAVAQYQEAGSLAEHDRQDLVRSFIQTGAFKEAYELWRSDPTNTPVSTASTLFDGGFEKRLTLEEDGFGWRIARNLVGVRMSQDSTTTQGGTRSLRIEFLGDSNPQVPLVSQFVLVQPETKYRISFAVRTHELVTGGLPIIAVHDAPNKGRLVGQSTPFPSGNSDWQVLSFEFTTEPKSTAVAIVVQRASCESAPCPIFGTVWLDEFSLEQVSG